MFLKKSRQKKAGLNTINLGIIWEINQKNGAYPPQILHPLYRAAATENDRQKSIVNWPSGAAKLE